jgi:hypothetical protein
MDDSAIEGKSLRFFGAESPQPRRPRIERDPVPVDDPVRLQLAQVPGDHPLRHPRDRSAQFPEPARPVPQVIEDQRFPLAPDDRERGVDRPVPWAERSGRASRGGRSASRWPMFASRSTGSRPG